VNAGSPGGFRALLVALVLGLDLLAAATPALGPARGIALLASGWFSPALRVPWSANVLLAASLVALVCRRDRSAAVLGWAAAALALTACSVRGPGPGIGYLLWQTSPILLALGARVLASRAAGVHQS
jgi:hypothetical protein